MKKLAIIGASYLQEPLIEKAKSMGLETHVFAWAAGDVGEKTADFFYPISIVEKEAILEKCREIGVDGICSISSDLAVITVNYVSEAMGFVCNSAESTEITTNKHSMREAFRLHGDPSPKSICVDNAASVDRDFQYPIIVKPVDRSGSRAVTKLEFRDDRALQEAVRAAVAQSFAKKAVVEEYVTGREYSIECISWAGEHHFLAMTLKYTTGAPHFIETAHLEPAPVDDATLEKVKEIVFHALDSLQIRYGASHSELKISSDGTIKIIEIGARMGGDCIGSHLVELSSGVDFVKAVIQVSLGESPEIVRKDKNSAAAIRFVFSSEDVQILDRIKSEHPDILVDEMVKGSFDRPVTDSSTRFGYYIFKADAVDLILQYLPVMTDVALSEENN